MPTLVQVNRKDRQVFALRICCILKRLIDEQKNYSPYERAYLLEQVELLERQVRTCDRITGRYVAYCQNPQENGMSIILQTKGTYLALDAAATKVICRKHLSATERLFLLKCRE